MSPTPPSRVPERPCVPGWQRPYVRRPGEVQFGLLPGAPVVTGVSPTEAALLAGLDGRRTREQTFGAAADAGVARRRWRELLGLALAIGVLGDGAAAPVPGLAAEPVSVPTGPPRRAGAGESFAARGPAPSDRTAGERRRTLHEASGPAPAVLLDGAGLPVGELAAALHRAQGAAVLADPVEVDLALTDPRRVPIAVAVLLGSPVLDPRRGDVWRRAGVPHLPVSLAGPCATVGPVVDPGREGPCLWCLDRHRSDRDDAWPTVLAQALGSGPEAPGADTIVTRETAWRQPLVPGLSELVTGAVLLVVGRLLRGLHPPAGVSVEVSLPWPRMDHRRWSAHPLCPDHTASAAPPAGPTSTEPMAEGA